MAKPKTPKPSPRYVVWTETSLFRKIREPHHVLDTVTGLTVSDGYKSKRAATMEATFRNKGGTE
jgi:hypothetical protein